MQLGIPYAVRYKFEIESELTPQIGDRYCDSRGITWRIDGVDRPRLLLRDPPPTKPLHSIELVCDDGGFHVTLGEELVALYERRKTEHWSGYIERKDNLYFGFGEIEKNGVVLSWLLRCLPDPIHRNEKAIWGVHVGEQVPSFAAFANPSYQAGGVLTLKNDLPWDNVQSALSYFLNPEKYPTKIACYSGPPDA